MALIRPQSHNGAPNERHASRTGPRQSAKSAACAPRISRLKRSLAERERDVADLRVLDLVAHHRAAAHAGDCAAPAPLAAPRRPRRARAARRFEIDRDEYRRWVQSYSSVDAAMRASLPPAVETLAPRPLISVIMPSYNIDPQWMREAIESVRNADLSALGAVHLRRRLDASRRARADRKLAAQDQRIRVDVPRHATATSRRTPTRALDLATGDYVALLDADDVIDRGRAVLGRARDRARSRDRHDLLRRGQDRPRGAPLRSLLQAGVESRADARAEHVLPSRRLPPQPGRAGRPLPRRLRGRAGSRSGAALRRRDDARAHPPHPARALSLARDRAARPRPRWRASPMRSRPA